MCLYIITQIYFLKRTITVTFKLTSRIVFKPCLRNLLFTILSRNLVLEFTHRVLAHHPAQWPRFNETAASCFRHENETKIFTRKFENGSAAAGLHGGHNGETYRTHAPRRGEGKGRFVDVHVGRGHAARVCVCGGGGDYRRGCRQLLREEKWKGREMLLVRGVAGKLDAC